MSLNLNDLLAEMEQSAGLEKTAGMQTEVKPAVSAELASVLTKKASADMTVSAFAEGEALAKELLTKLANDIQVDNAIMQAQDDQKVTPTSEGTINQVFLDTIDKGVSRGGVSDDVVDQAMDKEAQLTFTENQTMAKSIMQKLAQMVGEPTTTPAAGVNLAGAPVPNQIQMGNAEMTAYDDAKVQPMPGTDGTINNILEAIVAGAKAQGGASDDLVNGEGPVEGSAAISTPADMQEKAAAVSALVGEGMDFDSAVSLVKQAEESMIMEASHQEKIAAVNELTAYGYDFDTAVELVKQAEYEIANEEYEMEKIAAVDILVGDGYDFDTAVELVKEASITDAKFVSKAGPALGKKIDDLMSALSEHSANAGAAARSLTTSPRYAGESLAKNPLVRGVAGAAAAGGVGAAGYAAYKHHQKQASITDAKFVSKAGPALGKKIDDLMSALSEHSSNAGAAARSLTTSPRFAGESLAKNPLVRGVAGAAAAGGVGAAGYAAYRHHEKKSALDALVAEGIDFDSAVEMVKQAEYEVYGE